MYFFSDQLPVAYQITIGIDIQRLTLAIRRFLKNFNLPGQQPIRTCWKSALPEQRMAAFSGFGFGIFLQFQKVFDWKIGQNEIILKQERLRDPGNFQVRIGHRIRLQKSVHFPRLGRPVI